MASLAAFFRPSPELLLALSLLEGSLRAPAYRLWAQASFGSTHEERAAWVVPHEADGMLWVGWPNGRRFLAARWDGPIPAGAVAIVHTHPSMVDPKPSEQDIETARRLGVPVYTVSRSGIWKAVPDGSVVPVEDSAWWISCRSGACAEARNPETRNPETRNPETLRAARSAVPDELRNLGAESAYP